MGRAAYFVWADLFCFIQHKGGKDGEREREREERMESEKVVVDELPLAIVRRVVKDKLSECSPDYDVSIHKEAMLAFSESARIFIHYLSATYASKKTLSFPNFFITIVNLFRLRIYMNCSKSGLCRLL